MKESGFSCMLKYLFPKKCIFCESSISADLELEICERCVSKIPFHTARYLMESGPQTEAINCDRVVCALKYIDPVKGAMMRFKFFQKPEYAKTFSVLLCEKIKRMEAGTDFHFVSYVPLNKSREKERGYNQAKLIAGYIAEYFHIPLMDDILKRNEASLRQSTLQKNERHRNIKNAFCLNETKNAEIKGKTILLVDDIATTLSTLNTCARILKESGAAVVIGAVVASALAKE